MTRAWLSGLIAPAMLACTAPPPPPMVVAVRVQSDPGAPLAQAVVQYGGQTIATTGADGVAQLTLHGSDGESFDVSVICPAGYRSPSSPIPIVLRRLSDPGKVPEYAAACPPTTRAVVVAVKADRGPNLPVMFLGREIGRTDPFGAATVLLRVRPDEAFDLTLATAEKGNEQLRPQNPVATFTVKGQDDLFLFEPRFTIEPKKAVYRPPPPKGPVPGSIDEKWIGIPPGVDPSVPSAAAGRSHETRQNQPNRAQSWATHPVPLDGKLQAPRLLYMTTEPDMNHWRSTFEKLARDERGAVQTEYVVLVGTVGLAVMFAIVAVGPTLVHSYERTRDMIAAPFP